MQWTAPIRRHLVAKMRLVLRSGLSPLMANKRSSSHVRGRSGVPPTSDIQAPMSVFVLISSVLTPAADILDKAGHPVEPLTVAA